MGGGAAPQTEGTAMTQAQTFFSTRDILDRYGICRMTLKNWLRAGEFPQPMKIGSKHRWSVERIKSFEDRRIAPVRHAITNNEVSK
jgi:predicted DNA-binding transcriptional regulator AlpA